MKHFPTMNGLSLWCALLAATMCLFMPSRQSIWIDEAHTAIYAAQPDLGTLWKHLGTEDGSEALMPLGMLAAWVGGKVAGLNEYQLRLPNVLWMWTAVAAFTVLGRRWRIPWAPLVIAVQPFVWFYANEARPYSLQMGCSAVLAMTMIHLIETRSCTLWAVSTFLISASFLVATSLFGVLTAGPALLIVGTLAYRQHWDRPRWLIPATIAAVSSWMVCGVYYLSVLQRGAKGAKLWAVGVKNIAFAVYEFLGFSGIGPGREDLRAAGLALGAGGAVQELTAYAVPIAGLGVLYLMISVGAARSRESAPECKPSAWAAAGVCATAFVSTIALAFVAKFPFWGRHLAPAFPFAAVGLTYLLKRVWEGQASPVRWAVPVLLTLLLTSGLLLRVHPRHAKDDYRSAAAAARTSLGQEGTVWWAAEEEAGRYYGLSFSEAPPLHTGGAHLLYSPEADALRALPYPQLIVTTKPEIFDVHKSVAEFAKQNGFLPGPAFQSMQIWLAPGEGRH